jgi:hypothetical protein
MSEQNPSEKGILEQEIKELRRKVTNQKAHIFDLIEQKTDVMNDIKKLQEDIELRNREILNQQKILDGERKVLAEKRKVYDEKYPEVIVEKTEDASNT